MAISELPEHEVQSRRPKCSRDHRRDHHRGGTAAEDPAPHHQLETEAGLNPADRNELPETAFRRAERLPRVVVEEAVRRKVSPIEKRGDEQPNSHERIDDSGASKPRFPSRPDRRFPRRCDHGQESRASEFRVVSRLRRTRGDRVGRGDGDGALGRVECLSIFPRKRVHVLAPICDSRSLHQVDASRGSLHAVACDTRRRARWFR